MRWRVKVVLLLRRLLDPCWAMVVVEEAHTGFSVLPSGPTGAAAVPVMAPSMRSVQSMPASV